MMAIASGGCNVLSYLIADPAAILAVDLNRAHVALTELKLAAIRQLPSYDLFFRFFGTADARANVAAYRRFLRCSLSGESRRYWDGRDLTGRRRVSLFRRKIYRHGLLGTLHRRVAPRCPPAWRQPAHDAEGDIAGRAAAHLRDGARAGLRQAARPLADLEEDVPLRAWHSAGAIRGAGAVGRWRHGFRASRAAEAARLCVPAQGELLRLAGIRPWLSCCGGGSAAPVSVPRELRGDPCACAAGRGAAKRSDRGAEAPRPSKLRRLSPARRAGLDD